MQTECPHCHTVFRIDPDISEPLSQVRCGHCLAVFAPIIMHETEHDAEQEPDSTPQHEIEPEIPTLDSQPEPAATTVDDDDVSLIREKFEEKSPTALPDVIPPELRIAVREPIKQRGLFVTLIWSVALVALLVSAAAQYAWYNRVEILKHPDARHWYELACQQLGCQLPDPRDPSRIELSRKNIFTHPNVANALMVSGTLVNQAEFEQDYPLMELRFENVRGEIIAARRFAPTEYLDLPENQIRKMEPGNPMAFTLEIIDPGTDVVGYEFTFL
jgi:predicted Zn finger-like uncharacterized protein